MHVGAVLSPGAVAGDVELAELPFLWQFNVVAEVAVVALRRNRSRRWCRSWSSGSRAASLGMLRASSLPRYTGPPRSTCRSLCPSCLPAGGVCHGRCGGNSHRRPMGSMEFHRELETGSTTSQGKKGQYPTWMSPRGNTTGIWDEKGRIITVP